MEFIVTRMYDDGYMAAEETDSIVCALNAAAIYLQDDECVWLNITCKTTGAAVMNYHRSWRR